MTGKLKLVRAQYDDIQAMGGHFNYFDVRKKVRQTATFLLDPLPCLHMLLMLGSDNLVQCIAR